MSRFRGSGPRFRPGPGGVVGRLLLLRAFTLTLVGLAASGRALSAPADGLHRTLHLTFQSVPVWATGFETGNQQVRPLDDPRFRLNAGLRGGLERARSGKTPSGPLLPGWSSLPREEEAYPNDDLIRSYQINPFSIAHGSLVMTASRLPPALESTLPVDMPRVFLSGALNTYPYCQTYGYFEVTARVPKGRGLWPAFWLLPADGTWPPEIDAPEILGDNAHVAYYSLHTQDPRWLRGQKDSYAGSATTDRVRSPVDLSTDFHRYGVDWRPDLITFYIDGAEIAQRPTPADMHKPFYLIANLAVGGEGTWPGPPDAATSFPAKLVIKAIDVWARP